MTRPPSPPAANLAFFALAAFALGAILYLFDPATAAFYPPCLFRKATGYLCPGCGSLRAAHALLHGDLAAAWGLNPLLVAGLPVGALLAGLLRLPSLQARGPAAQRIAWFLVTGSLVAAVAFGVLRNVPGSPLRPRPGEPRTAFRGISGGVVTSHMAG